MSTVQDDVLGGTPGNIQADVATGLVTAAAFKAPCVTISTTNLTLSGLQTVNGKVLAEDDRVLINAQTLGTENGIWIAQSGAWYRAPDFNSSDDVLNGTLVYVGGGSSVGLYVLTTADPIVLDTTSLSFGNFFTALGTDMASQVAVAGVATTVAGADLFALFVGGVLKKISGTNLATWIATLLTAFAPLASPVFTGNPTAPTPAASDNDTSIATTAYVQGEISPYRDPFLYDQYGAY